MTPHSIGASADHPDTRPSLSPLGQELDAFATLGPRRGVGPQDVGLCASGFGQRTIESPLKQQRLATRRKLVSGMKYLARFAGSACWISRAVQLRASRLSARPFTRSARPTNGCRCLIRLRAHRHLRGCLAVRRTKRASSLSWHKSPDNSVRTPNRTRGLPGPPVRSHAHRRVELVQTAITNTVTKEMHR